MDSWMMFTLLVVITVSASSHPFEAIDTTTTSSLDDPNKIFFTLPSGVNMSQAPIRVNSDDESRLEITLKMDESDKEIVDSDMGKRIEYSNQVENVIICKKAIFCDGGKCKQQKPNIKYTNCVCETNPET